jgi:hypothetical protein
MTLAIYGTPYERQNTGDICLKTNEVSIRSLHSGFGEPDGRIAEKCNNPSHEPALGVCQQHPLRSITHRSPVRFVRCPRVGCALAPSSDNFGSPSIQLACIPRRVRVCTGSTLRCSCYETLGFVSLLSRTQPFLEWARLGYPLVPRSKPIMLTPTVGTWRKPQPRAAN